MSHLRFTRQVIVCCLFAVDDLVIVSKFVVAPAIMCIDMGNAAPASIDTVVSITVNQELRMHDLVGIMYFGGGHFVARFVNKHGLLWFQDGATDNGTFFNEGYLYDHSAVSLLHHGDKRAVTIVYVQ